MHNRCICILYYEFNEDDDLCVFMQSESIVKVIDKTGSKYLSYGIPKRKVIGYTDTNIDNLVKCIMEKNASGLEKFDELCKIIITVKDNCDLMEINSDTQKWKKVDVNGN